MMKVHAPNEHFRGTVAGVEFSDGVGEYDPKQNSAAARYFERQGYGVGKKVEPAPLTALEEAAGSSLTDAREHAEPEAIGTRLRDAAVDPRPEDFLPPTNAGSADPHGPEVVAPQIHGSGTKGIRPGVTHVDEPDKQQAGETDLATSVLVEGKEHPVAAEGADRGPLGLSDPGSVAAGVSGAKEQNKVTRSKGRTRKKAR